MKVKTTELKGNALNWAVAKCEGHTVTSLLGGGVWVKGRHEDGYELDGYDHVFGPSFSWTAGGPIIEREFINLTHEPGGDWVAADRKAGQMFTASHIDSPLIAAMRVFVLSHLGAEVDVPLELL